LWRELVLTRIGLTGGIVKVGEECKSAELNNGMGVTVYHFVESIEEVCHASSRVEYKLTQSQTQKKVEELGGKACSEKTPEGENGWYMYIKDVAGNRFGIYQLKE
jgi:hypothetical protein